MKITFFNQFHNGDCFVGKGWIRNIMNQLPDVEFFYAHNNHPDIIKDLGCQPLTMADLPDIDRMTRLANDADGNLYINTWCGAFQGELFGHHQHSNYIIQHRIYQIYCENLSKLLKREITQSTNPHDYLPFIDFGYYPDTIRADEFVREKVGDKKLVLVCNGSAMSGQSEVGDLGDVITLLCQSNPEVVFVASTMLDIRHENLYYTQDIFDKASDLNEIAYLSKRANIVVGKNSGPYSYCQFKDNMETPGKTFFSFNKLLTDCLNAGLEFQSQFKFSDQKHSQLLFGMINREINNAAPGTRTGMQHLYA
jgi:hypothetical protein